MARSEFDRLMGGPIRTEGNAKMMLRSLAPKIKDLLPDEKCRAILQQVALHAILRVPKLADCTGESIAEAVMRCARTGLMPDGHEAAIIPFKDTATFVPMYHGLVKLAYNHPSIKDVMASVLHEKDHFEFDKAEKICRHRPPRTGLRGILQGAYFVCNIKGGGRIVDYMTVEEIDIIKSKAPGARKNDSPWNDKQVGYPRMCEKTIFIRNRRWIPTSEKLQLAMTYDDQVWREHSTGQPQVATAVIAMEPGDVETHTHPGEPIVAAATPEPEQQTETSVESAEEQAAADAKWVRIIDGGLRAVEEAEDKEEALRAVEEELANAKKVISKEVFESLEARVAAAKAF